MVVPSPIAGTIDDLRLTVSDELRSVLDEVLEFHLADQTQQWPTVAQLLRGRSERALRGALHEKGGCIAWIGQEAPDLVHLELVGALLSSRGRRAEQLLSDYLIYLRQVAADNPSASSISSDEIRTTFNLSDADILLLGRLIFLHPLFQRGGSMGEKWQATVPDAFASFANVRDPTRLLERRLLDEFDPAMPIRGAEREAYRTRMRGRAGMPEGSRLGQLTPRRRRHRVSADAPITSVRSDRLGRAKFAEHLANALVRVPAAEGFVAALGGPWGSGKTSVLNLVEASLCRKSKRSTADPVLVVKFNPWWFSGDEAILREFLSHLEAEIISGWHWPEPALVGRAFQVLVAHLAPVAAATLGAVLPHIDPVAALAAKPLESAAKQIKPPAELTAKQARDVLVTALRSRRGRIVVILDDIDRLRRSEIQTLFRVIKAVGQFPNTVYLLAFDYAVVISALRDVAGTNPNDYLEKIVQATFTLPAPDPVDLDALIDEDLSSIIGETPEHLFSPSEWRTMRLGVLRHLIRTPRDVARYVNSVALTYPGIRGEVNVVDFLAVQALRTFAPPVYDAIQENPPSTQVDVGYLGVVLSRLESDDQVFRRAIQDLVLQIFPQTNVARVSSSLTNDELRRWRVERRVASDDARQWYFTLAIPRGSLSQAELRQIVNGARDGDNVDERLMRLARERTPAGVSRIRTLLNSLVDLAQEPEVDEWGTPVVTALHRVVDRVLQVDVPAGSADREVILQIEELTHRRLQKLSDQDRTSLLEALVRDQRASVGLLVWEVAKLAREHGLSDTIRSLPSAQRLVSTDLVRGLEEILIDRIRTADLETDVISTLLPTVLLHWGEWDNSDRPRQYLQTVAANPLRLAPLIHAWVSGAGGDGRMHSEDVLAFGRAYDLHGLFSAVRELAENPPGWLTQPEADDLKLFLANEDSTKGDT